MLEIGHVSSTHISCKSVGHFVQHITEIIFEITEIFVFALFRRRVPLETLQEDLNIYLKTLQNAMIELINKDYADFVNLSTNLVGLDKAINSLTTPLGQLNEEVMNVQSAMDDAIQVVQNKLTLQAKIRGKKASLQRLTNITQCVNKMEKLLGIQASSQSSYYSEELSGHLIERVATEFNKLQFYVNKSRGLLLVDNIKPRITAITSTLQQSLEGSFIEGLGQNNSDTLLQCLRTYATIDKMSDAENLFRQYVVRPYMEGCINEEFIVTNGEGLHGMYAKILDFIPKHCKSLKDVTYGGPRQKDMIRGYDFLVNAVWPEIVANIEARTPSIFAPGNPNSFHQKYEMSMQFVERFEIECGSQASVKRLRTHPSYNTFMSKWSLPVYFQIRFQEIAGAFETALLSPFEEVPDESVDCFHLTASHNLWQCLEQCWREDVFLQPLCHRFWKLTLQLLARYAKWIEDVIEVELKAWNENESPTENMHRNNDKTHDPAGTGQEEVEVIKPRVVTMSEVVKLIADIDAICIKLPQLYGDHIKPHISRLGLEDLTMLQESLDESSTLILKEVASLGSHIVHNICGLCSHQLKLVSDTPRLYRRTNRDVPAKPSGYVSSALKPVNSFNQEYKQILKAEFKTKWINDIMQVLTEQYFTSVHDVLTSVKKMEESLKRLKRGKAQSASTGMSDDDKIRLQLSLDVKEFGKQIEKLGIQKEDVNKFVELEGLVNSALSVSEGMPPSASSAPCLSNN